MLYVDGWDGMVIIGHRSSRSTFGANNEIPAQVDQQPLLRLLPPLVLLAAPCARAVVPRTW